MRIPETIMEGVETLLAPYQISFKKMLTRYLSASPDDEAEDEWITLKAAAGFAKVSIWTMRRWCRKGVISKKTSQARCGRILISKASLRGFIDNLDDPAPAKL